MVFDFGALPPEINSGRMYSGPGSSPMLAAASAWDTLAIELRSAATHYQLVLKELTSSVWVGPTAQSMLSAVMPYVSWLSAAAGLAEETGIQGHAAAAAYEMAFMMTVPPPVIAANRLLSATLIASNFFGQNTPAIAATEAQYLEMWAQDAAAMFSYAASSATATELTPFGSPPHTTTPLAAPLQAAATQAAAGEPTTAATQLLSAGAVPQALQQLAASPAAAIEPNFIWNTIRDFLKYGFPTPENNWAGLAPSQYTAVVRMLQAYFGVGLASFGTQIQQQLFNGLGTTAGGSGAWYPTPQFAALGAGGWHFHSASGVSSISAASIGSASKVGVLSVPVSWANAPGTVGATSTKLVSATYLSSPGAGNPANAVTAPGAGMPLGSRAGQRGGNMGVRYGFRYTVLARPPSAG